jgi:hypothetical protein
MDDLYVCMNECMYVCVYVCVCVGMAPVGVLSALMRVIAGVPRWMICMYVCMYVCKSCTCIHTHIHTYSYICIIYRDPLYVHTYIHTYTSIYIHTHLVMSLRQVLIGIPRGSTQRPQPPVSCISLSGWLVRRNLDFIRILELILYVCMCVYIYVWMDGTSTSSGFSS